MPIITATLMKCTPLVMQDQWCTYKIYSLNKTSINRYLSSQL